MTTDVSLSNTSYTSSSSPLTFPVDPEHSGIRVVGCFTFFLFSGAAFLLYSKLLPDAALVNLLLALLSGAFIAYVADAAMKRSWPSGRRLVIDGNAIQVMQHNKIEMRVDAERQVNIMPWRFTVRRNGRARKGWYVIALGLEQDEMLLPVYTFAPPERFEALPLADHFTALQRDDKKEVATGSARELKAAGQQRRLHEAEKARSVIGAEVTVEQFESYVRALQEKFPHWMPQK